MRVDDGAMANGSTVNRVLASGELLERAGALATLDECLEEVQSSGCGQIVLVGGEAGVGKTSRRCDGG